MSDRSAIDPANAGKRKRYDSDEESPPSPIIKPTKKRPKVSGNEKMAVNGSPAQREKNAEFLKKLKAGETSCTTRVWDKAVYLAERRQNSKESLENIKILEDDPTEFKEVYNHSNILAGAHECPPCGKTFVTAFHGENDYKMDSIKRHILSKNHQNRVARISQPNKITFEQHQLDAIQNLMLLYVAKRNLPFDIFSPEKMKEAPELLQIMDILVHKVAKMGKLKDFDSSTLKEIFIAPKKMKERITTISKKLKAFYMFHLPILAEHGLVSLVCDHKHIGKYQSDPEKKCFGICAVITDSKGHKRRFILDYMPVESSTVAASKEQIYGVLRDYDLLDSFKKGKMYFAVDAFMYTAVHEMFVKDHGLEPLISICSPHNWSNASKRTLKENITQYWAEGANTVEALQTLINDVKHFYGDYFTKLIPRKEDYGEILKYIKPNMTTAATNTFEPKKFQSIPTRHTIRFRNTYHRFRIFLSWVPELLRLQDPKDSAYQFRNNSVYVSQEDISIAKSIYEFSKHTVQFVDYFEADNNYQMVDVMNAYINGFKYACDIRPSQSMVEKYIRLSYMDSLTEQLFGHKMIRKDGQYIWDNKCRVPIRISTMHLAAMYLNFKDRHLNLSSIRRSLHECAIRNKNSAIYEKCYLLQKKLRDLTENWKNEVEEFFIIQDKKANPEAYKVNNPARLPYNDDLDDFLDDLPPPESQSLFENETSETQILFNEVQDLCTPTQNVHPPLRKTKLQNEFHLYKNLNKLTYQEFEKKYNFCTNNGKEEFVPQGKSVQTFWKAHRDIFPIMSQIANRLVSVTASSSIIEREFSKVSAVVTKVRNRMSARSVLHFIQLKEHQAFAEGVAEKFRELDLNYEGDERNIVDHFDLDYAEAIFDENFEGTLF